MSKHINKPSPEYIKIINSGYENPSFVSPIVENYATNVKPVVKIDQINLDPAFNNWENVEYVIFLLIKEKSRQHRKKIFNSYSFHYN